jgi:hypothetical protein
MTSTAGTNAVIGPFSCGYCGRPCSVYVWLNGIPYHEECTHGPSYQPQTYQTYGRFVELTEVQVRQIVREEIERLKDQIEAALGVRP